jgi:hypothetical protein
MEIVNKDITVGHTNNIISNVNNINDFNIIYLLIISKCHMCVYI